MSLKQSGFQVLQPLQLSYWKNKLPEVDINKGPKGLISTKDQMVEIDEGPRLDIDEGTKAWVEIEGIEKAEAGKGGEGGGEKWKGLPNCNPLRGHNCFGYGDWGGVFTYKTQLGILGTGIGKQKTDWGSHGLHPYWELKVYC
ncbi:hypothetical protein PPACK8108_LOCUS16439 [Phakopsora pachyrhizi]|uniref:Uncharacterized protein n=1 Tax=Phakopsora pachyrhizi TaxID=170000 RepID=A0AAV0BBR1_PHAPC|nr:hypothetical protein PPACK8108_LOCUS16439 [Phakopsora pachyrhizi]